uniref:Uncharacterized protein n=1 Tax=Astyanax mexicanus TaxID=7994 RepID=A0A8B9RDE9_ASTMX
GSPDHTSVYQERPLSHHRCPCSGDQIKEEPIMARWYPLYCPFCQ